MGKAGRIACTVPPMMFTIGSLICLVLVMVGQLGNNSNDLYTSVGRDLYFFKVYQPPQPSAPRN
jgi:hypothetical protein